MTQRNKIGVYILRQIKKLTWLQACFLGDVRVIWCNSLGDSLFQTYVMNFVKIVINYYLHITSHESLAIASYTYYTSYSLLNLVHDIVCEFVLGKKCVIILFWSSGLKTNVFEKLLKSFSCFSYVKTHGLICFCIIFYNFQKNQFSIFFNWVCF